MAFPDAAIVLTTLILALGGVIIRVASMSLAAISSKLSNWGQPQSSLTSLRRSALRAYTPETSMLSEAEEELLNVV